MITRLRRWAGLILVVVFVGTASIGVAIRRPILRAAGRALVVNEHVEPADIIVDYCKSKIPMRVVEAINANIKALLRRGRGYRDLHYLLLKA